MRPPSGEQIELRHGEFRLTVVEVGGGMRRLGHGDWALLDGYPLGRMCDGGRGQPLIPWPNRIRGGRYAFDGRSFQLPLTEVDAGNAIHGLVRWAHWRAVERSSARVVVEHTLDPQPGYPFALAARIEYVLSDDGLRVVTSLTNVGASRCPFGVGFHPYFSCGDARVDLTRLALHSEESAEFRRARPIGAIALDRAFTRLERDDEGRAFVELLSGDGSRDLRIWLDEHYRYVQIFTGDTLPESERRRGVAVEPMTCPANAFVSGEGLLILEPGGSFQCAWGVSARRY